MIIDEIRELQINKLFNAAGSVLFMDPDSLSQQSLHWGKEKALKLWPSG